MVGGASFLIHCGGGQHFVWVLWRIWSFLFALRWFCCSAVLLLLPFIPMSSSYQYHLWGQHAAFISACFWAKRNKFCIARHQGGTSHLPRVTASPKEQIWGCGSVLYTVPLGLGTGKVCVQSSVLWQKKFLCADTAQGLPAATWASDKLWGLLALATVLCHADQHILTSKQSRKRDGVSQSERSLCKCIYFSIRFCF